MLKQAAIGAALALCSLPAAAWGLDFQVIRVAHGLSQPNEVVQVAGDPSNILYYTQRAANAAPGFSVVNTMGSVMRYDTSMASVPGYVGTPVITFSNRQVFNDDGLEGVAFSPDFNNPGTPGFGKIYVSSSTYNGGSSLPTNRVEEYTTTNPANPTTANTTFTRTILQYTNNAMNNHTIDQVSFDPTATGEARNYLYISTGNGSFGDNYNGGVNGTPGTGSTSGTGQPSQNPADVKGKILRVDVNGTLPDAYPSDPNKNFAIPSSNPIPTYNAAHPSTPIMGANTSGATPGLGEVYITGLRNAYRFSFDTANGNMMLGDVGENAVEEVDIVKAGMNTGVGSTVYNSKGPVDFGWPQKEGTSNSTTVSGAPNGLTNPFTGATSLLPIQQFTHTSGNAVIGGYVYRGPVASLQGLYFYSDFVQGTVRELNFDPSTDPTAYTGANGTVTSVTTLLNSVLSDPNDPTYTAALGAAFGLGHVVSFGQDNAGNLYIVDFGGTAGDNGFGNSTGEYPSAGLGEIFEIVPVPEPASLMLVVPAGLLLRRRRAPR